MNPVTHAKELVRIQGWDKALDIASKTKNIMAESVLTGAVPLADEVEISQQDVTNKETGKVETKTITIVDQVAKAKRLNKGLAFWTEVFNYLNKRKPSQSQSAA